MSEWGSFVDGTPSEERRPAAGPPPPEPWAGSGSEWGSFADGTPTAPATPVTPAPVPVTPAPIPGAGAPIPSPETVASLLTAGETLWARVDGPVAVLGSGCSVTAVYDDGPDGFSGWRPVTVLDPARLTVRPLPLALAEPPVGAAASVAELYADPGPADTGGPRRAVFPVGQGPDLDALLGRALAEERERARAEAAHAARQAEEELAAMRRQLAEQAGAAEQRARQREGRAVEAVQRAHQEADRQVAATGAAAQRQIAEARDQLAQTVQGWQFRTQQAEAQLALRTAEVDRVRRVGVQRLLIAGVLAVLAVVLAVAIAGA